MSRVNENRPDVVARIAESLRDRRVSGIPEPEMVAIAELEGVWAYQIMAELDLSNQRGVFLPRPPRPVAAPARPVEPVEPDPAPKAVESTALVVAADVAAVAAVQRLSGDELNAAMGWPVTPLVRAVTPLVRKVQPAAPAAPTSPKPPPKKQESSRPAESTLWGDRLRAAVLEQLRADPASESEVVVPLDRMAALGWPASSLKYPTIWATGNDAGRTARAMGWEPRLRDGVGLVLRRTV